jgi:hypothetical protein
MFTTATRYRKEFNLPASWVGDNEEASIQALEQFFFLRGLQTMSHYFQVWLDFEGAFRETTIWINGDKVKSCVLHSAAYFPGRRMFLLQAY